MTDNTPKPIHDEYWFDGLWDEKFYYMGPDKRLVETISSLEDLQIYLRDGDRFTKQDIVKTNTRIDVTVTYVNGNTHSYFCYMEEPDNSEESWSQVIRAMVDLIETTYQRHKRMEEWMSVFGKSYSEWMTEQTRRICSERN